MPQIVAIDPGLDGTGWARWRNADYVTVPGKDGKNKPVLDMRGWTAPDYVGVITPPRYIKDWTYAVQWITNELFSYFDDTADTLVFCEMMEWQASAKRAVAWKTGALQKTTVLIGFIGGRLHDAMYTMVPVRDWKGQLPKDVVERRIRRLLGDKVCRQLNIRSHAWDAVGIGLWAQGVL